MPSEASCLAKAARRCFYLAVGLFLLPFLALFLLLLWAWGCVCEHCCVRDGAWLLGEGGEAKSGLPPARETTVNRRVMRLLEEQIRAGQQLGVHVVAYSRGMLIVDCWAGSDGESAAVGPETLYPSFSVGKGVAASCAALCVDRGQLDYDEHLTERLWPEFAQRDPRITVAQALSHRAGVRAGGDFFPPLWHWLCAVRGDWRSAWETGVRWVEEAEPHWVPGTEAKYHVLSFSFIAGGIVERAAGTHITEITREVATLLGEKEGLHLGCVPDTTRPRVTKLRRLWGLLRPPPKAPATTCSTTPIMTSAHYATDDGEPSKALDHATTTATTSTTTGATATPEPQIGCVRRLFLYLEMFLLPSFANSSWWLGFCLPSSNGVFNARAVGKMYGALANNGAIIDNPLGGSSAVTRKLISPQTCAAIVSTISDPANTLETPRGAARLGLGWRPWLDGSVTGASQAVLHHSGLGGSFGFADPGPAKLGVAVLRNGYTPVALNLDPVCQTTREICSLIREHCEQESGGGGLSGASSSDGGRRWPHGAV